MLRRNLSNNLFGGVCSGFADYLGIDVTAVRLLAIAGGFASLGTAGVIYLILWLIVPPNYAS